MCCSDRAVVVSTEQLLFRGTRSDNGHRGKLLGDLMHHMTQLRSNQLFHSQLDGVAGTGSAEDRGVVGDASNRSREHRGGANFLKREHPENLAKTIEAFLQ